MNRLQYEEIIRSVMLSNDDLTTNGYGVGDSRELRRDPNLYAVKLREGRQEFFTNWAHVQFIGCCEFVDLLEATKHPNPRIGSSYSLKHVVEKSLREKYGSQRGYVANGVFIASALHKGFTAKRIENGLNALFNISKRSLNSAVENFPAPAEDIIDFEHNSAKHKELVSSLENLHNQVATSNQFAALDIEDQKRRLSDIETTLSLMKAESGRKTTINALIGGTLVYLIEQFAGAPIGEAAQAAWQALKAYIGI